MCCQKGDYSPWQGKTCKALSWKTLFPLQCRIPICNQMHCWLMFGSTHKYAYSIAFLSIGWKIVEVFRVCCQEGDHSPRQQNTCGILICLNTTAKCNVNWCTKDQGTHNNAAGHHHFQSKNLWHKFLARFANFFKQNWFGDSIMPSALLLQTCLLMSPCQLGTLLNSRNARRREGELCWKVIRAFDFLIDSSAKASGTPISKF